MECPLCEGGTNCQVHDPEVYNSYINTLEVDPCINASGGLWFSSEWSSEETGKKEKKKMAKKTVYKVVVKDGDTKYALDKNGQYKQKTVDYVQEFDNLGDALASFLEYDTDAYNEDKVTLTLTPSKKK